MQPSALDVRWAKWSLLVRSGQGEQSVEELRRIAAVDTHNPLIHLRLARELRKLDHLEASLQSYKKAVELAPDMHGWRLAMARARFDVLDYEGAVNDVQYVLDHIPPGSPWSCRPIPWPQCFTATRKTEDGDSIRCLARRTSHPTS